MGHCTGIPAHITQETRRKACQKENTMLTQFYTVRAFTQEEIAEAMKVSRQTGIPFSASSIKKGRMVPVEIETNLDQFTEYLQGLTGRLRASVAGKKGETVNVIAFDYQRGDVSDKAISAGIAAKLINSAMQVGIHQQVILDFSTVLFDEDGYFNQIVLHSQDEKIRQAQTLQATMADVIRQEVARKAKKSVNEPEVKKVRKSRKSSN